MISFTSAHRWNSLLCPPLGFIFNFLLLWLILHRTPKEMRVHSRILLQTCLLDSVLLALQCIGQIVFVFNQKSSQFVFFYDGYLIQAMKLFQAPKFLFFLICIWLGVHNLSISGIAVQFIYRYLALNRNIKVKWPQYLLLLSGPTLYITVMTVLVMAGLIEHLNRQSIDRQRFEAFVDFEQQPLYLTAELKGENQLLLFAIRLNALLLVLTYAIILFCGWKMVRFVRKNTMLTSKLKELNRQLTKCLIILACFPLCICFFSLIFLFVTFFNPMTNGFDWTLELELFIGPAYHWLPVLNPLTTIYINRPYRNALIDKFVKIAPIPND